MYDHLWLDFEITSVKITIFNESMFLFADETYNGHRQRPYITYPPSDHIHAWCAESKIVLQQAEFHHQRRKYHEWMNSKDLRT